MFSIQLLPEKALSLNQSPIVCVPDSLTAHLRGFAPRSAGVQMDRPESVAAAVAKYIDSVRAILAKLVCVFVRLNTFYLLSFQLLYFLVLTSH